MQHIRKVTQLSDDLEITVMARQLGVAFNAQKLIPVKF